MFANEFGVEVFLRLLLLGVLDEGSGDAVHVGGASLSQGLAHGNGGAIIALQGDGSEDSSGGELIDAVADVLAGSAPLVRLARSIASASSVVPAHAVDTDLLAHVDLVCDGGSTGVEPVVVIRGELLEARSLNVLAPVRDLDFVSLLQMLSECFNEILCRYVFNGGPERVDQSEVLLHGHTDSYMGTRRRTPAPAEERLTSILYAFY